MKAYRITWMVCCGALGVFGVIMAASWPLSMIIMLFVLAALAGATVAMIALGPPDTSRLPRDRRRAVTINALLSGVGTVAFIGMGTLLGAPTTVLLLAVAAGGSPFAIRYYLTWRSDDDPMAEPAQPEPAEAHVVPGSLSDHALCVAWRASFSALQRADSPPERLLIVEERLAYFEELERRNPSGMAAWLASGARAAGDPSRFVLGEAAAGASAIDWDRLIHGTDK